MLHIKFRGNRPAGFGEDFLRVFTIYGRGGHLGHFHFLVPESFHKKIGSDRHSSF